MVKLLPSPHRTSRTQPARYFSWLANLSPRKLKRSAVTLLPRRAVLAVTQPAGLFWTLLTPGGRKAATYMRSAYRLGRLSSVWTAARWKAHKLREAVIAVRLEEGKERVSDWPVVHHNKGAFDRLVQQGEPFILVTGHFAAMAGYGALNSFPVPSITVAHGVPGELSAVQRQVSDQPTSAGANVQFVVVGESALPAILTRRLTTPGTLLILSIDDPNVHTPYWRPFAGHAKYPCHPHAARLSRLAQRPVVFNCVTWNKKGQVCIEWSNAFEPPARDDRAGETDLTNALFDELEAAIGRHPTQYTWITGFDRYWDNQARRWRSRDSG